MCCREHKRYGMISLQKLYRWILGILIILSAAFPCFSGTLTAHFIDVGQGDSVFIETESVSILVDGGDSAAGPAVNEYLLSLGVNSLDLVVASHPHADHIGGLIPVLQTFPAEEVIDPGAVHTTVTFERYLNTIDEQEIPFTVGRSGMKRRFEDGLVLRILHPADIEGWDLNNASLVTSITYDEVTLLLTGDVEAPAEQEMILRGEELQSQVLKIPHHGSSSSTTDVFLEAVSPQAAVIMCGEENPYGHPHREVLERLYGRGIELYRTDLHGTVRVVTDGRKISIETEKTAETGRVYEMHAGSY